MTHTHIYRTALGLTKIAAQDNPGFWGWAGQKVRDGINYAKNQYNKGVDGITRAIQPSANRWWVTSDAPTNSVFWSGMEYTPGPTYAPIEKKPILIGAKERERNEGTFGRILRNPLSSPSLQRDFINRLRQRAYEDRSEKY